MSKAFTPAYLSSTEASEYLHCQGNALKHLVAEGKLKAGIFVPTWTGEAFPVSGEGVNHKWEGGISNKDEHGVTDTFHCSLTGETFSVRRGYVSQYWYIHHSDAYIIATTEAASKAVSFLEPVDGDSLHRDYPEHFPHAKFIYWLNDEQEYSRSVSWAQLLFQRRDLDSLIDIPAVAAPIKEATQLRDSTMLKTVATLMSCWPGGLQKIPTAKDLEKAATASDITISDDSIRKVLKEAEELIKQTK